MISLITHMHSSNVFR